MMTCITKLKSQTRLEGEEAVFQATGFKKPVFDSTKNQYEHFTKASDQFSQISKELSATLRKHHRIDVPELQMAPVRSSVAESDRLYSKMEETIKHHSRILCKSLRDAGLGSLTWHGDESCIYDFPDTTIERGILENTISRSRKTHDLVKARLHRIPCDIPLSDTAKKMIQDLPSLRNDLRIVSGFMVVKHDHHESTDTEQTELGKFLSQAAMVAAAAGAGLAAGFAPVAFGSAVAVGDPALCLGDIVLCGWEIS